MRSSTQERFRRDVLGVPPGPDQLPVPAGMVVVAPPAPDALTDLLAGYRATLQVADQLPPLLTVRAGDGTSRGACACRGCGCSCATSSTSTSAGGSRTSSARSTPTPRSAATASGELAAIEHFEQAVAPVPVRRIVIWFAVSVIFSAVAIANVARALAPEPLEEASTALRGSVERVVTVNTTA